MTYPIHRSDTSEDDQQWQLEMSGVFEDMQAELSSSEESDQGHGTAGAGIAAGLLDTDSDSGSADEDDAAAPRKAVSFPGLDEDSDDSGSFGMSARPQPAMFDEEDGSSEELSGSEGSEDDDMVAASAAIEARRVAEAAAAAAEMQHAISENLMQVPLPTAAELGEEDSAPPDLPAIAERMRDVVGVLGDFRRQRIPGRSRGEYMEVLEHDMRVYFGYDATLIQLFLELLAPGEALQFLEANETARPLTIRTNTLRTRRRELAQALIARGVNLDPLADWTKEGLKVYESPVPIGATPEYLAGHYMLQSASSMVPVLALAAKPGERICDMASAPGGKTTHIAQMMRNQGMLVANDAKAPRCKALMGNLSRLGVTNAIVCNYDGRKLPAVFTGFDRVLLDAPCTGLGVIARDPSIKANKSTDDVTKMAALQKQLLLAAIDMVDADSRTGAVIVYSTCSVAVEEDEMVVDYVLKRRHVRVVPLFAPDKPDIGSPGLARHRHRIFHPSLSNTRRFWPHIHNMDGFFVCKLQKMANGVKGDAHDADLSDSEPSVAESSGAEDMLDHKAAGLESASSEHSSDTASSSEAEEPPAAAAAGASRAGAKRRRGGRRD